MILRKKRKKHVGAGSAEPSKQFVLLASSLFIPLYPLAGSVARLLRFCAKASRNVANEGQA